MNKKLVVLALGTNLAVGECVDALMSSIDASGMVLDRKTLSQNLRGPAA